MITSKVQKILGISICLILSAGIIAAIVYFVTLEETKGAVVTNGHECAEIGASILDKGGNAVDAAIASLFCEGVAMPQSMGLGGGFLMTIYIKEQGKAIALNARETAPAAATENMFADDEKASTKGGLAVAIPADLRGYWYAYKKYGGKLPWKDLVQPTIDLCRSGILVTEYLARTWSGKFEELYKDKGMRECFIDPKTNFTKTQGQYVKRLKLADTLEIIAKEGGDALHNGSLTEGFVRDIQKAGGIITVDDMKNYKPEWQEPIKVDLPNNQILYTTPLPGSGVILSFILNILKNFLDTSNLETVQNWQRIIESFKYGYARRTELGDPDFVDVNQLIADLTSAEYGAYIRTKIKDDITSNDPAHYGANTTAVEDHGTAHISVLAPNGDAVSVTSTINLYFGAGFMSESTGIILNDEMDDFSSPGKTNSFNIPPSVANYIRPNKRPLSSMCPSIIVDDNNDVRLVIGAAGGSKITSSVALTIVKSLWFEYSIKEAILSRRLHHQLFPMYIEFEEEFQEKMDIVNGLAKIGHEYQFSAANGFSALTAISKKGSTVEGSFDKRRPGQVATV